MAADTFDAGTVYAEARLGRDTFQKDLAQLRRDMAEFERAQFTIPVRGDAREWDRTTRGVRADAKALNREEAKPKVGADDRSFTTKMFSIRATLKQVSEIVATPLILVDIVKSLTRVAQLKYELRDLARDYIVNVIIYPQGLQEINKISNQMLSLQNLTRSMIPLAAEWGGALVGAVGILGSSLLSAGGAAAVFGLAASTVIKGLVDDSKALEDAQKKVTAATTDKARAQALKEYQALLKTISPDERQALQDVTAIKTAWTDWQKSIQPAIFSSVHQSVSLIQKILPMLTPIVTAVAEVFNGWMISLEKGVDSGGFKKFTDWLTGPGVDNLDNWGRALGNFGAGFVSIFMAMSGPTWDWTQAILNASIAFKQASDTIGSNPEFINFMRSVQVMMPDILTILKTLLPVIMDLHRIFAPMAEAVLGFVAGFAEAHPVLTRFLVVAYLVGSWFMATIALVAGLILKILLFAAIFGRIAGVMAVARTAGLLWGAVMAGEFGRILPLLRTLFTQIMRLTVIGRIFTAITNATRLWAAAQAALNWVMGLNPIILIIAALIALGAALYLAYQNIGWFKDAVDNAWAAVSAAFMGLWEHNIKPVVDWIVGAWGRLVDAAQMTVDNVVLIWNTIIDFFKNLPQTIANLATDIWGWIVDQTTIAWGKITSTFVKAVDDVGAFLRDLPKNIAYWLGFAVGTVARWAVDTWKAFISWLPGAAAAVEDFFHNLGPNIGRFLAGVAVVVGQGVAAWGVKVGTSFMQFLTDVGNFLSALPGIVWDWILRTGDAIGQGVAAWWGKVSTSFDQFLTDVGNWFTGLPDQAATAADNAGEAVATGVSSWWDKVSGSFMQFMGNVGTFFANLGPNILTAIGDAATWLWDVGGNIISGLWEGIKAGWNAFWGFLGSLWDSFIQGFKDAFGIASPSSVFAQFGVWILEGLLNGLVSMAQTVGGWLTDFANWLLGLFGLSLSDLGALWDAFWNTSFGQTVQAAIDLVTGILGAAWDFIRGIFTGNTDLIRQGWEGFWNAIYQFAANILGIINNAVQTALQWIEDTFGINMDLIQQAWAVFWGTVQTVVFTIFDAVRAFIQNIWNVISNLWMAAQDLLSGNWDGFWQHIQAAGEAAWAAVQGLIDAGWNIVKTIFNTAIDFIVGLWNTFWDGLKTATQNGIGFVQGIINTVLDAVKGAFNTAVDAIGTAWGRIREIVAAPIRFMVNLVYNQGIVPAWNFVAGLVNLGKLNTVNLAFAKGGVLPGYSPGVDNHRFIDPVSGMTLGLGGGEGILRPEIAKATGRGWIDQMNYAARVGGVTGVKRLMKFGGESHLDYAYAQGGLVGLGQGGGVVAGQNFARAQAGKPYVWGGVGPGGYDCSGFISAVTNAVLGQIPYTRRFATGSFGPGRGAGGFVPGTGSAFVIGVSPDTGSGIGHMAGNLGGMGIESRGGDGVVIGGGARSPTNPMFPWQFYLPQVGGQFVDNGGIDIIGKFMELWAKVTELLDRVNEFMGTLWGQGAMGLVKAITDGIWDHVMQLIGLGSGPIMPDTTGNPGNENIPRGNRGGGGTFDQGGVIQPGWNSIYNGTGKPELAGRTDQWAHLIRSEMVSTPGQTGGGTLDQMSMAQLAGTMTEVRDLLERNGAGATVIVEGSRSPVEAGRAAAMRLKMR
jgi:phage-related protein